MEKVLIGLFTSDGVLELKEIHLIRTGHISFEVSVEARRSIVGDFNCLTRVDDGSPNIYVRDEDVERYRSRQALNSLLTIE